MVASQFERFLTTTVNDIEHTERQSWLDPSIILMGLPGALAGILWMLWATHTTISVPAVMGSIMSYSQIHSPI